MRDTLKIAGCFLVATAILMVTTLPASAAAKGCSYSKTLQHGGYTFDISSHPADGCAIQIVSVTVRRGSKTLANYRADVDYLVESAWAADLNADGKPELAVTSRSVKTGGRGTFDIYWVEGKVIRRASMQEHEEGVGYRGQDSFRLHGSKIERSFPVYLDTDLDERPSGGKRNLQYAFSHGKLELLLKNDNKPAPPQGTTPLDQPATEPEHKEPVVVAKAEASKEATPAPVREPDPAPPVVEQPKAAEKPVTEEPKIAEKAATEPSSSIEQAPAKMPENTVKKVVVKNVTVGDGYIEIEATEPVVDYKVLTLDKPARIAIDFPAGLSKMAVKSVKVGRFGITKARIGSSPDKLRVVLDSAQAKTFPQYRITTNDNRLRISFVNGEPVAPTAAPVANAAPAPAAKPKATARAPKTPSTTVVTDVVSGQGFIDIVANRPIADFKLLELEQPTRLVIDIFQGTATIKKKTYALTGSSFDKARVGLGDKYLRVVLDSPQAGLPKYKVTATDKGLRIDLQN